MDKPDSCRDSGAANDSAECNAQSGTGGRGASSSGGANGDGGIRTGGTAGQGGNGGSRRGSGGAGNRDAGVVPVGHDASPTCPDDSRPAVRRGSNLYLLVDDSLSVVLQPAWNSLTLAINAFVDDPRNTGLGVGIGYYGISCNAADYEVPAVPVAPLPGSATPIKTSYPLPINGKAITPALNGALTYAHSLAVSDPDRDAALVLVTDGVVDPICASNKTSAAQAIAAGLAGTPPVPTYVIALGAGPSLLDPANIIDLAPLDDLAAAGGTKQAQRIEVNLSTNDELTAALRTVAVAASPCTFEIPPDIDPDNAALDWQDGATSEITRWPRVPDANACNGQLGAFVRPEYPRRLELCPTSCNVVRSEAPGSVLVKTRCP